MFNILTFEEMNLDKYKHFFSKYKKSGYLSRSTIGEIGEIGLRNFNRIYDSVDTLSELIDRKDDVLLSDILIDAKDDFQVYFHGAEYHMNIIPYIDVLDKRNTSGFFIEKETPETFIFYNMDLWGHKFIGNNPEKYTSKDVHYGILKRIENSKEDGIEYKNRRELEDKERRPGSTSRYRYKYTDLDFRKNYDKTGIKVILSIKLFFPYFKNMQYNEKHNIIREFEVYLSEEIIKRYFSAIGFNKDFTISNREHQIYDEDDGFSVKSYNIFDIIIEF